MSEKDLISRQQAIHAFDDAGFCSHDYIVGVLRELPSTQPERKKGKWLEKEYSPFYCSVCGTYQYSASWEIKNKEYNFCPRCGADMRGESDDQ